MAAEVPVSDVLCEAMEYLSKLGSNLRTRSESLKEKRISKAKLKNSHAVQKAANKVLLICELSKKSLDNVEAGIRRVLSLIEASQASVGGQNCDVRDGKNKVKYHYFEYLSHKLRIAKKINLKHFMSLNVVAKRMPASMQDKYPVYYDSKLKRHRRRAAAKLKFKKHRTNSVIELSDHDPESVQTSDSNNKQANNMEIFDHGCGDTEQKSPQPTEKVCDIDDINSKGKEVPHKDQTRHESDSDPSMGSSDLKKEVKQPTQVVEKDFVKDSCEKDSSCNSSKEKSQDQSNKDSSAKKKSSKIRVLDIYSSDSDDDSRKLATQKDNQFSSNTSNKTDCINEPKVKKLKLTGSDNSKCQSESDSGSGKHKIDKDDFNKVSMNLDSENDSVAKQHSLNGSSDKSSQSQPLIRCVNLSKLLKPSILADDKLVSKHQQQTHKKKATRRENKNDEFWIQKRKELKMFKPKAFSINIERLPNLSVQFLLSNKLKRVTKGGKLICEVKNESDTPNTKKMKAFKNALLNDSESDECRETNEVMKVKKSLLIDSESDEEREKRNEIEKRGENCDRLTDLQKQTEKKSDTIKNVEDIHSDKVTKESQNNDRQKTSERCDKNDVSKTHSDNNSDKEQHNVRTHENSGEEDFDKNNDCAISTGVQSIDHSDKQSKCNEDKHNNQSNENQPKSLTNINQEVKSSLLNDSSDEDFVCFRKNYIRSEKSASREKPERQDVEKQCEIQSNEHEHSTERSKADSNVTLETNENIKTSLLNDSSDDPKESNEQSPSKTNEKSKSSLLNDSSDVKSDESVEKERQKTPKSKRKHARKCREAKKNLKFYSSSDSEQENPKHKLDRKKLSSTSSSSSEDIKKKDNKKKKKAIINSDSSSSSKSKTIDQVDDGVDEKSISSVDKMVRSKAKPSGSSSLNSDNQDASDKDIDGLTNLKNLSKIRRRDSRSRVVARSSSRPKPTPTIGEDLLKAESSSAASEASEASAGEDDLGEVQDLPAVPMVSLTGLNGDHLAKDDLLGDTDSSSSNDDKDQTDNADNSGAEDNVKSIRRKANTISSDSEGGSNNRKKKNDSDFEDSEAESSESGKKAKRKKKATDSDASGDSNDGGQKKRRRIKVINDSEGSGSDTENEGRNKHGRKNIRKVMGKNQLEEATKKAAREEKERIARILDRQKVYNNLEFDESGKPDEVILDKVVLDFDPETKEPLIQVDKGLVKKLKPHQANGIKFMWDACFESVKRIKKDRGSGCILAHCMGLGKTLQVISLTHTLLIHNELTGVNRVLVVCPLSTVLNWVSEIRMWLKYADAEFEVDVYELSRYKQNSERAYQLQQWFDGGGVCVLGYEMFRNLSAENNKKYKKKMLKSFQESLVDPGPDLVVCDEGHLLKNEKTSLSQSMNKITTRRRIVLTGTPLQNNLKEYYCMVQFVKPNLLGKYNEYLNRFVNPITNGQYTDSTEYDIKVMKRRSHVLHKMLDGAVQRRDYGVLAPFLPPKHEFVLFITLTDIQVKLYEFYLENYSRRPLPGKSSGFLFPDFQSLQRVWTHPLVLKYNSERYEIMQQKKRDREEEEEDSEGSLADFIDDDSTPDESTTEESTDDSSAMSDDSRKKSKKKKAGKKGKGKESKGSARRGTRANPLDLVENDNISDEVLEVKNENPTEWWMKLVEESELEDMKHSHKLVLLFDILRQCEAIGDKLLVFSQSLYSLDLIEHFLGKVDEATQDGRIDEKLGGHVGSWSPGVDYFRLDGSTSCENRSIWCKNFNREDNPRARLFLISTRAGGLGINLVAANRVVIFDVSWNPSHDVQSIFRVYRFGQKKPCYVYRFLAMGTMEEKIYERQVTKQAISKRVIDEQQIDRHYAENDLAELYKFEARPEEPRPLPPLPKDRLFAEMLKEHEAQIYKYHEHDSLLENKEEETLSEEERKAAWEDFENEKTRPPPAPFPSTWPMHNGLSPIMLQQQHYAYTALAAMLRKDMPNINENQIRDMLPLIYNANPQLMQKMSEIYKYAQPGMMNPGMMNPVMNAGGAGAGAGSAAAGGASGLQYEPPWQRQHQQQQQMRLQQLMQHQNQMGAKFYSGGLGSRDPIAMALQQQRAREMLMGGAGAGATGVGAGAMGRPRGRPPLQPRHPTTSQDVVNLDSD